MKITSLDIIGQLERLAEGFPWDEVELSLKRKPEGEIRFVVYIPRNEQFGFESIFGFDQTPEQAVTQALSRAGARDPDLARNAKIVELRQQIEKLQAVVIGMPPYRPNRELSNGEPAIRVNETVDV